MEARLSESTAHAEELQSQIDQLETEKADIETEYKSLSESNQKKISDLESMLSGALTQVEELQLELSSVQQEVGVAKEDVRKFSEQAVSTQELYERELLQHGRSMENLHRVKEEVKNAYLSFSLSPFFPSLHSLSHACTVCLTLSLSLAPGD